MARKKTCSKCLLPFPLLQFSMNGKFRRSDCKSCRRLYKSRWRSKNQQRERAKGRDYYEANKGKLLTRGQQRYHRNYSVRLRLRYGITEQDYRRMLSRQGGKCAICRTSKEVFHKRFAVDHCHRTGRIRGILCLNCNTKLGWFEKYRMAIGRYVKR